MLLFKEDGDVARLFDWQRQILESLMPPGWFATPRHGHRAYDRWQLCSALAVNGGRLRLDAPDGVYRELISTALDTLLLAKISGSSYERRIIGSFDAYGDASFATFRRARLLNRKTFDDVLTELTYGAWEVMNGASVTPIEVTAKADMLLTRRSGFRASAECKRLTVASRNRIHATVNAANRQLRNTQPELPGVLFVDCSALFAGTDRPSQTQVGDEAESLIAAELRAGKHRSVSAVVLAWDHYDHVDSRSTQIEGLLQRRTQSIRHEAPWHPWPIEEPLFDGLTGYTDSKRFDAPASGCSRV